MNARKPIHSLIEAHVLAAERLHGDDTTVSILAKGKTDTDCIWTDVRDDRPFGGLPPPAALFHATREPTTGACRTPPEDLLRHSAGTGLWRLQSAVQSGSRSRASASLCWAHSRRKFFVLADIAGSAKRGSKTVSIS